MTLLVKLLKSPYSALTVVPLIWGSNFIVGKQLTETFHPFTLTASRFATALLCLLPIYFYNRRKRPSQKMAAKVWGMLVFLGLTGTFAFGVLLYAGLSQTSPVNATLINGFNPSLTILLSVIVLGEKLRGKQVIGLILSVIGVAWIAVHGQPERLASLSFNPGDLLILAAALVWAIYSVGVKKISGAVSIMDMTTYTMLFGVLALLPSAYLESHIYPVGALSWQIIAAIIYLGVFPSVIAFLLWNWGVAQVGPSKAAMLYNMLPVFTAIMSYFVLGEVPKVYHLVGGTLVLWGVIWGTKRYDKIAPAKVVPAAE